MAARLSLRWAFCPTNNGARWVHRICKRSPLEFRRANINERRRLLHLVALFAEALQFIEQCASADAECFGRFCAVELVLAQGLQNRVTFNFLPTLMLKF